MRADVYLKRGFTHSALLAAVLAIGAFFAAGDAGHGQALGKFLFGLGYRTTGWAVPSSTAGGWVPTYGLFDPNVTHPDLPDCFNAATRTACIAAFDARYGGGSKHPSQGGGNLVGERFSDDLLAQFFVLKGLTPAPTHLDRTDAEYVLTAWDGLILPAVHPPNCEATHTCTSPPCAPPLKCVDPKTCLTICPACPVLVAVPADILATAKGAPGWISSSRKAQRARLKALADWLAKVESVKVKP